MNAAPPEVAEILDAEHRVLHSADGATLSVYRLKGRRGGPVLLWGHANGFAAGCYPALLNDLAHDHDVWAWDARGQGGSVLPRGVPAVDCVTLCELGRDAALICQHVSQETGSVPNVAAHSFSGSALLWCQGPAQSIPWRSATLFEPPLVTPARAADPEAVANNIRLAELTLQRRRIWDNPSSLAGRLRAHPGYALLSAEALKSHCRAILRQRPEGDWELCCTPEVEAAVYRAVFTPQVFERLAHVDQPVQFVASDPAGPSAARASHTVQALAAEQVRRPVIAVRHSSHFLPLEQPAVCAAIIRRTIADAG